MRTNRETSRAVGILPLEGLRALHRYYNNASRQASLDKNQQKLWNLVQQERKYLELENEKERNAGACTGLTGIGSAFLSFGMRFNTPSASAIGLFTLVTAGIIFREIRECNALAKGSIDRQQEIMRCLSTDPEAIRYLQLDPEDSASHISIATPPAGSGGLGV